MKPKLFKRRFHHYKTSYNKPHKTECNFVSSFDFLVIPSFSFWVMDFKKGYHKGITLRFGWYAYTFRWTYTCVIDFYEE